MPNYPCPACGFVVFEEPAGNYAICNVCGWEDDHVQLANPQMSGGANRESLVEAQSKALERYPLHVTQAQTFTRDATWRPWTNSDAVENSTQPDTPLEYFEAAAAEAPKYYWRSR